MLIIIVLILTNTIFCDSCIPEKYEIFPKLPPGAELSDNQICADHSRIYRENLDNSILWAYEMWDSTAKSTVGVLKGSSHHLGHFEQCLAVQAPFPTQYCLVTLQAIVPEIKRNDSSPFVNSPNELVIRRLYYKSQQPRNIARIGWCTPASCKPEDLQNFLQDYVKDYKSPLIEQNRINFTVRVSNIDCQSYEDQKPFDILDVSFCILCLILITTGIVATIFDRKKSKNLQSNKLLMAFSLKRNLPTLLKVDDRNLAILNGVRAFAIICVICLHRYASFIAGPVFNMDYFETESLKLYAILALRSDLVVDIFFTMGGILVAYNLLSKTDWRLFNCILSRYIRVTPVLGFVIFFYATLYNHTGSGPLWKQIVTKESTDCRTNWWTNLLYINNYINFQNMCIVQSWYLPCDFHYFLIAIAICLVIKRNHKIGLFLIFIFSFIPIIVTFALIFVHERNGIVRFYPQLLLNFKSDVDTNLIYVKSHTRASPYFIGMLAGYFHYKLKDTNKTISKLQSYTVLTISVIAICLLLKSSLDYFDSDHVYNKYESAFYGALNRPIFALCSVGILYVANYSQSKWLYNLLNWKTSIPVAKLSYCAYLIHLSFQLHAVGISESPRMFLYYSIITWCLLDVVLSFFAALLLYLLIETPFRQICRIYLSVKKL